MALRLAQISDIHSENYDSPNTLQKLRRKLKKMISDANPHVLALPGDVAHGAHLVDFINSVLPTPDVAEVPYIVFVAGNHEYYNSMRCMQTIDDTNKLIHENVSEWNAKNAHHNRKMVFLDNASFVLTHEGTKYRFSGGTLWTDMDLFGTQRESMQEAQYMLNDYAKIMNKQRNGRLEPSETIYRHMETLDCLKDVLEQTNDVPDIDIVMTHHHPTLRTALPHYKEHPATPCFASNLDEFIISSRVSLWLCGHSHGANSVFMGNTLVSCNTYGYTHERDTVHYPSTGKLDSRNNEMRVLELEPYEDRNTQSPYKKKVMIAF